MASKNIIVCCDGTWNSPDQKSEGGKACPTNVAKLFESVCPYDADGNPQVVQYIRGVGTRFWERVRGGGFGYGISENIREAHKFISSNYQEGDRIFLFGFSRGAYTARSIAGLIHNVGILKRNRFHLLGAAYDYYRDKSPQWAPDSDDSKKFRADNGFGECRDIHFLGVWDTVGALGAPYGVLASKVIDAVFKCGFHDITLNPSIRAAAHAVAMDERRWPFRPNLLDPDGAKAAGPAEDFEERWFPGVHSDVGGGYPETALSDIALDWMAGRAARRGLCLNLGLVDDPKLSDPAAAPDPDKVPHRSQTFGYRLATLALVKLPAAVGIPLPGIDPAEAARIAWNGDYRRPVPEGRPAGHVRSQPAGGCPPGR
jgi:uncharacterized protein (DUF2235 family)